MDKPAILNAHEAFVVVPVEPTEEMVEKICQSQTSCNWPHDFDERARSGRRAFSRESYRLIVDSSTALADASEILKFVLDRAIAAEARITALEALLVEAERALEPFADGRARTTHANGCRYHGGHDCDCGKDDYLSAASTALTKIKETRNAE